MNVTLQRRATFSAAHSYALPDLSPEQNRRRFGKFSGGEGHGHNYTVQVDVAGEIDQTTGMVVNITDIDLLLKQFVINELGNRFLNKEVAYFRFRSTTTENIVRYIATTIYDKLPSRASLVGVTVWEMDRLWANLKLQTTGEQRLLKDEPENLTMNLTRSYEFSASHRLHSAKLSDQENVAIFGKCNNPNGHGHNYEIEVTMTGVPDHLTGMLYPLDRLDKVVDELVLKPLDHKHLNLDIDDFKDSNPTSEMLAVVIWKRLATSLPTSGNPHMSKVLVRETARNSFEYCGE